MHAVAFTIDIAVPHSRMVTYIGTLLLLYIEARLLRVAKNLTL